MEVLIRPWRKEDFPVVRRILWESWIAAYSSFIPEEDLRAYLEATYRIASLSLLYDSTFIHGLIGEADGEAVGFARTQFHKNENRLYLASLYLLPAYQGKGIGGRLLRAAEEKAGAYGLTELWVGVMVRNEAAGRWYERKGFRFVKEEPFRMGGTTVLHKIGYKTIVKSSQDADLQRRLFAVYDGNQEAAPLADLAAGLLERQKETWPGLAEGYAALEAARVREIRGDGWGVKLQFNPRRIVSTGAKLDPESIRKRPCFLCLENLPPEQQAILYRDDYLVLCNPAPIFPGHLTIAHRHHLPQSLPENLPLFLRLAADFGPRRIVFYNGPQSGASAPDHLHFQSAPAGLLPVEEEVLEPRNGQIVGRWDGVSLRRTMGLGRGILVIEGEGAEEIASVFGKLIEALRCLNPSVDEPLLNLFGAYTGKGWRLILFPRLKLRPAAYFREGEEQLLISPGAVDIAGILITPREKDFLALDREMVRGIFREVAFDDAAIDALIDRL
ncbi:MAG: GNAT family N-acetyltransferase [Syntrophales bacterium]|nr:GNAT family N-acetyltransferase [Syntrophales bacterium]